MKVVYGPLVTDARGRMGGVVASAWRATHTFRRFRAPSNPNTAAQQEVRRLFINLTRLWIMMGTHGKAAWNGFASGKNFQGRNALIARNVPALQGDVNLADLVGTPGDASTLPPASMTITPGANTLTVVIVAPALPTGWTITRAIAFRLYDQDFSTQNPLISYAEGEDLTTPYSIELAGTAGNLYNVRGFLQWLAPDGTARYSASLAGTGTPE